MTVGQRIREKRIEQGLTQEELATKMGYSGKTSVSMAENCKDNITTTKIEKFAKALGCSTRYLLFGDDDEWRQNVEINVDEIPFDAYEPEFLRRAIKFLQAYNHAIPEIQSAVDSLLKEDRSDP